MIGAKRGSCLVGFIRNKDVGDEHGEKFFGIFVAGKVRLIRPFSGHATEGMNEFVKKNFLSQPGTRSDCGGTGAVRPKSIGRVVGVSPPLAGHGIPSASG